MLSKEWLDKGIVGKRIRTTAPNDHIFVAVFHGISKMTSGLDHIGAPTSVPDVAQSESTG